MNKKGIEYNSFFFVYTFFRIQILFLFITNENSSFRDLESVCEAKKMIL